MKFSVELEIPEPFAWCGTMSSDLSAKDRVEIADYWSGILRQLVNAPPNVMGHVIASIRDGGCAICKLYGRN